MGLGLLCPGQGDQSPDMFSHLIADGSSRAIINVCARAIGADPLTLGPQLHVNRFAQPVVCAVELATWELLRAELPVPRAIAGYSVGELAAWGCAGAISPQQVIELAAARAHAMDEACVDPCGMVAVRGLTLAVLQPICAAHGVEVAIINEADRLVIGGRRTGLDAFIVAAEGAGAKVTPLSITIASHTSLMRPAVSCFHAALEVPAWKSPFVPVLAGINGSPVHTREHAIAVLAEQLASPVLWAQCLDGLAEMGCTVLLELGPGNGLSRMAQDRLPHISVRSVADFQTLRGAIDWVQRNLAP